MMNTDENFDAEELMAFARINIERNELDLALARLKRVMAGGNVPADAYTMAARIYAQLKLFDRAKSLFQKYLTLAPDDYLGIFNLGMSQFDSGDVAGALGTWDKLLAQVPLHPPTLFYKALAMTELGQRTEAVNVLDGLLRSIPPDNLFFERGRELRQKLDSEIKAAPEGHHGGGNSAKVHTINAYKTE